MRVLLGVTGGIAAYKVALVVRRLMEDGHSVRVIPTEASLNFVGRATWEALTGKPARAGTFENVPSVEHVMLGQCADIVLVAPATADFLASYAHGEARDLLGNALLATSAPVIVAPAMHTEMWEHAATQENVATLKARGVHVVPPASGRLTGKDSGVGRLPEPDELVAAVYAVAESTALPTASADAPWGDLEGVRLLVTAGGTREPIDSVRFLGNRSTGHQGFAIAEAARERGAAVSVIAANVELPLGEGIDRIDVVTGREFADAVNGAAGAHDVIVMAAAVADYRPVTVAASKMKKSGATIALELVETEDVLAGLVAGRRQGQVLVGFAAETGDDAGDYLHHGAAKAVRKGADLLAVNRVGEVTGFGDVENEVHVLDSAGKQVAHVRGTKGVVAHALLDAIVALRDR